MEKSEALNIARSKFGLNATNRNSHFSKVNASKDVWWIEVSIEKITDLNCPNLYFLLQKGSSIDVLDIPTEFLRESADGFRTRTDKKKNCMCFEIDIVSYKDVVGPKKLDLRRFLVSP